jgi:diguanylate cyclase (GGDEF)-like protein/PAS domain S-box-containing protein
MNPAIGDLEFVRAVLDALPDHIYVKDLQGRYLLVNGAGLRERNLSRPEDIAGKTAFDLFPRPLAERMSAEDRAVIASGEPLVNREAVTSFPGAAAGPPRWHITTKAPLRDAQGRVIGVLGINRDITDRKRAELALRESEEMFRAVFDQAAVGITLVSLDLRYLRVNDRFCEILGYTREELLGMSLRDVNPAETLDEALEYRRRLLAGEAEGRDLREKELVRKDGARVWLALATSLVRGEGGEPRFFVSVVQDISEQKRVLAALRESEERLRRLAHFDALTGLPNRALFYDRLQQVLAQAARQRWTVGVMYLDVDHFKRVNDSLGHAAGDQLLREVAARLAGSVRASDTVARLGGDEFAVVLGDLAAERDAGAVAGKILAGLREPVRVAGREIAACASIGIALFPQDSRALDRLVKCADAAMYQAKAAGGNGFRYYGRDAEGPSASA